MTRHLLAIGVLLAGSLAGAGEQSPQALLQHAIALHQQGDIEGAIRGYREYLKSDPGSVQVRSNLGAALARAGHYDEAIGEYQKALSGKRDPAILVNLALAYFKTNRIPDAALRLRDAHRDLPANRQVTLLLADCELRLGNNSRAIDLLTPLEQDSQGDQAFNYLFGMALIRDQQASRGSVVIDRILRNGDSGEARLLLGTTKLFARDYAGALPELRKAVELNPKLLDAHAYYGQALLGTGDQAGAADAFRAELALNPNGFLPNLELGVLAKQDQDFTGSREYFARALLSRPGDPGVRFQLATIELAQNHVDTARELLEKLVKESPQFTEAHVSLATVYYRLKRKDDADRERAQAQKLIAAQQAKEPGAQSK